MNSKDVDIHEVVEMVSMKGPIEIKQSLSFMIHKINSRQLND